jgi:AcrR family transcriptional regulator
MDVTPVRAARSTYRHGDLRRALLDAGIELARTGGPEAVVLREATRRTGVVPNAAYRHFASRHDLLQAVRTAALSAMAVAIEQEMAKLPRSRRPGEFARASLRAVGIGYLRFALAEPGLFRTAFTGRETVRSPAGVEKAGKTGLDPLQLLGLALDRMVEAGALPEQRRAGAELLAWSAVHGLAMLLIEGPVQLAADKLPTIVKRLLDMVEAGL